MNEMNQNQLAQIEQSVSIEQIQLSEKLGAIKATSFIKKLVTVTEIKLLAEIKETKQYKGLKLIDPNGELVTVTTFEEFCRHLGMSREKVDQDILNLSIFGQEFLETSQRMGLGYRDLRKLRKLSDEDREVIINGESVKAEDRESLIDLIEEMSAKHSKDKANLNKKVADLSADKEALETISRKKDEKLNQLDAELTKLKSPVEIKKRAESEPQLLSQKALEDFHVTCMTMLNATTRFVNEANSIMDVLSENALFDVQEQIVQSIVATFQTIAQTATDLNVQVDFEEMVTPAWMTSQQDLVDVETSANVEQ